MATTETSKAQTIREYMTANPNAKPAEIAEALADQGIRLKQVYQIRNKVAAKAKTAGKKKASKKAGPKKSPTQTKAPENGADREIKGGRGKTRPYPQRTLEEALAVPKAIRDKNNGRPMDTEQVAKATLNVSKLNTRFFYVAAASRDYGLTIGSRDTDEIALTPLGQEILFAKNEETRKQKMIDAFMSVDLFKKVYEYYGGSKSIPTEGDFFGNVLVREFQLDPDFHEEFERIFRANCKYLEIEDGLSAVASDKAKAKVKEPASEDIRVVGAAKGKFDRTAFVIMPFSEKGANPRPAGFFEAVLNNIIVPAGNSAGFAVETARKKGSDVIHTTIINALLEADLVIADLTDHNPNVLCELGIRLANEKPVALIRATATERIFDVDILRIEDYNPNIWPNTVENDIPKIADHIKATWDNRDTMRPYMEILTGRSQSKA
jgi:hypothetical protein